MRTPTHNEARELIKRLEGSDVDKAALMLYVTSNRDCEGWDLPRVARVANSAENRACGAEARVATLTSDLATATARFARLEAIFNAVMEG